MKRENKTGKKVTDGYDEDDERIEMGVEYSRLYSSHFYQSPSITILHNPVNCDLSEQCKQ